LEQVVEKHLSKSTATVKRHMNQQRMAQEHERIPSQSNDDLSGPRGNRQSWRHLDEVGRSASRAPDNKPGQRDEREYLEEPVPFEYFSPKLSNNRHSSTKTI
jgi:hypothetical protein